MPFACVLAVAATQVRSAMPQSSRAALHHADCSVHRCQYEQQAARSVIATRQETAWTELVYAELLGGFAQKVSQLPS